MKKVAIIGAGPAGIATALQLKKYGISFYLIEKKRIGGLIYYANHISNYPGYPKGISGGKLCEIYKKQLQYLKIDIDIDEVININYSDCFALHSQIKDYQAKYLVLSTGTLPKLLDDVIIDNKATIYYDLDNITHVRKTRIAIIGAGDCAFDYALTLSKFNYVTIFNKNDYPKANYELIREVNKKKSIDIINNTSIKSIKYKNEENIINYYEKQELCKLIFDYIIVAIGRIPNNKLLENLPKEAFNNIYLAGDVKNGLYRQSTIAIADGIKTAMSINERERI